MLSQLLLLLVLCVIHETAHALSKKKNPFPKLLVNWATNVETDAHAILIPETIADVTAYVTARNRVSPPVTYEQQKLP